MCVVVDACVGATGGHAWVGVGAVEGLAVGVRQREGQGAGHHRRVGGGEVGFCGTGDEGAEVCHYGVFDEAKGPVFVCVVGGWGRVEDGVAVGCVFALWAVESELLFCWG